jgi:Na+-transporting methylmalonyl-CoA/oxaloacetate decarboxylase beta subunit
MKNKKWNELSTDELLKNQKSVKVITYMLSGVLLFLFCMTLFLTVTDGFTPLLVVPIALFPILIMNFNTLNEIKKVLTSRNTN